MPTPNFAAECTHQSVEIFALIFRAEASSINEMVLFF